MTIKATLQDSKGEDVTHLDIPHDDVENIEDHTVPPIVIFNGLAYARYGLTPQEDGSVVQMYREIAAYSAV